MTNSRNHLPPVPNGPNPAPIAAYPRVEPGLTLEQLQDMFRASLEHSLEICAAIIAPVAYPRVGPRRELLDMHRASLEYSAEIIEAIGAIAGHGAVIAANALLAENNEAMSVALRNAVRQGQAFRASLLSSIAARDSNNKRRRFS